MGIGDGRDASVGIGESIGEPSSCGHEGRSLTPGKSSRHRGGLIVGGKGWFNGTWCVGLVVPAELVGGLDGLVVLDGSRWK